MKLNYVNLGCGGRFHPDWINVDFSSVSSEVIEHDLRRGIPLDTGTMDVVYHAHVLEHFTRPEANSFMKECYRVLKPGGIIRIAVPDLESIAREYLRKLEGAIGGNKSDAADYEWIMLEMFDQMVRNSSGGEMAAYLAQPELPNEPYILERIGEEGRGLRMQLLNEQAVREYQTPESETVKIPMNVRLRKLPSMLLFRLKSLRFTSGRKLHEQNSETAAIGIFRKSGEIHQWMYDRYSLSKMLDGMGFKEIRETTAFDSRIPDWNGYGLESVNGEVLKPDSLFMEAIKPR